LRHYLQTLGTRIGNFAELRGTKLIFNLVEDNNLNAFAVPGGYITFNTGLLMATDDESELASVVAHEIAHLTQRHLPRLIARANENKLPTIAAIIGSILIGGQAGLAGITLTSATVASNQLAFTRDFEREADSIGIKLLAASGHDPRGMPAFFGKLEKYNRHDNTQIPEFLRTHPLTFSRLAESEARALDYPAREHHSSFEYYLTKAKIRALYIQRQKDPLPFFEDQKKSDHEKIRDAAMYGIGIIHRHKRQYDQAAEVLAPLIEKYTDHPWVQSAYAELELKQNNAEEGMSTYQQTIEKNPDELYLIYRLADAYMRNNNSQQAKKLIRYQIRRHPENFRLYKLLSRANANLNQLAEAHLADGEYHGILGDYSKAIAALKLALREAGSDNYLKQRATSRQSHFEEKLSIQEKIARG